MKLKVLDFKKEPVTPQAINKQIRIAKEINTDIAVLSYRLERRLKNESDKHQQIKYYMEHGLQLPVTLIEALCSYCKLEGMADIDGLRSALKKNDISALKKIAEKYPDIELIQLYNK